MPIKQGEEKGIIFLVVCRNKDAFMDLRGSDGSIATTLSQAASHLYTKAGKQWKRIASVKRIVRERERARERGISERVRARDAPWPYTLPDVDRIASLHVFPGQCVVERKKRKV